LTQRLEINRLTLRLPFWHQPADERIAKSQVMDAVASTLRYAGLTAAIAVPPPVELPVLTTKD
jgi:hypothetical protein